MSKPLDEILELRRRKSDKLNDRQQSSEKRSAVTHSPSPPGKDKTNAKQDNGGTTSDAKVRFRCEKCQAVYVVDGKHVGRTAKCAKCSAKVTIPSLKETLPRPLPTLLEKHADIIKECKSLPERSDKLAKLQGATELVFGGIGAIVFAGVLAVVDLFMIHGEGLANPGIMNITLFVCFGLVCSGSAALFRAFFVVSLDLDLEQFFELVLEHLHFLEDPDSILERYVVPSQQDVFKSLQSKHNPFVPLPLNCEYDIRLIGNDEDRVSQCNVDVFRARESDGETKRTHVTTVILTAVQSDMRDWYLVLPPAVLS